MKKKAQKVKKSSVKKTARKSSPKGGRKLLRKKGRVKEPLFGEDKVRRLLEKGKQRGFVTESEILHVAPAIEEDIEGLEDLYRKLEVAKIKIVELKVSLKHDDGLKRGLQSYLIERYECRIRPMIIKN